MWPGAVQKMFSKCLLFFVTVFIWVLVAFSCKWLGFGGDVILVVVFCQMHGHERIPKSNKFQTMPPFRLIWQNLKIFTVKVNNTHKQRLAKLTFQESFLKIQKTMSKLLWKTFFFNVIFQEFIFERTFSLFGRLDNGTKLVYFYNPLSTEVPRNMKRIEQTRKDTQFLQKAHWFPWNFTFLVFFTFQISFMAS